MRIEDVCTPAAFARNPQRVHDFYNARRAQLAEVAPNPAHRALARLEADFDGDLLLVTQNVDDLHERAGSRALLQMHGELRRARCLACMATPDWTGPVDTGTPCPECGQARLRPDVVWFGEMPLHMEAIEDALMRCELFVAIGTSGTVHPAAGFVQLAGGHARTVELNLEPSDGWSRFNDSRHGPATRLVPAFVDELLAG